MHRNSIFAYILSHNMGNLDYLSSDIKKSLLEGKTYNDVCNLITEELGINDQVVQTSHEIMEKIEQDIRLQYKQYFANVPGVSYIDSLITHIVFGKTLTIKYRYINYRDKSFSNRYDKEIMVLPNDFNLQTKTLRLTIKAISGRINIHTYADTIQHEIEHYFQEDKIGYSFSNKMWYKIAQKCKQRPKNSLVYMLGDMIYITLKCEEEAFTNGLYSSLTYNYTHEKLPTVEIINDSPVYNALLTLRKERDEVNKYLDDQSLQKTLSTIKTATGKDFEQLMEIINKGENELIKRIGRVIVKAQKDCDITNDMWANNDSRNTYTKESVQKLYSLDKPIKSNALYVI